MHHGLTIANHGDYADPGWLTDLAVTAEEVGWDSVFVWDHIGRTGQPAMTDPWIALSAIAVATSRVRIGTMVTPLPRRRPWKLAREVASLDHLSGGRVTLGVGLGAHSIEFDALGEETDLRRRAAMLDEGLDLLRAFWSGESVSFAGDHYRVDGVVQLPRPLQDRVPIWVAGRWPNKRPMQRAARLDGAFPISDPPMSPADFADVAAFIQDLPTAQAVPFDLVHEGTSQLGQRLGAYADAGVTWWLERCRPEDRTREQAMHRITAGPTRN